MNRIRLILLPLILLLGACDPSPAGLDADTLRRQTHELIGQSAILGRAVFSQFLRPLGVRKSRHVLPSR